MLATYTDTQGNLVVEFAVPGREAEHIEIDATEDSGLLIKVAAVENTPGSIMARPLQYEIQKVDPAYSIPAVHAVCKHGLLKLTFPPCPRPVLGSKLNMGAFARQQNYRLN